MKIYTQDTNVFHLAADTLRSVCKWIIQILKKTLKALWESPRSGAENPGGEAQIVVRRRI